MLNKLLFLIIYVNSAIQLNALDISKTVNKQSINSLIQRTQSSNNDDSIGLVDFEVENEIISLNLIPLVHNVYSFNTSVLTVESDINTKAKHVYKKINNKSTYLGGKFYEDFENKAIVYKSENNHYDGVYGEGRQKKTIQYLLGKPRNKHIGNKVALNIGGKKISTIDSLIVNEDFVYFEKADKTLETLYPKLLLVVEWNYFKMLGGNNFDAIKYLSIFWNAVNLKYKEISFPKINIIISGIVISKDDAALDFVNKSRTKENPNKLNDLKLVSLGNQYFNRRFKKESGFSDYDAAVLMTNLTAGSVKGITIRGQICQKNIIYVTDDADFGGILKATHELGHSLGLSHDDRKLVKSPLSSSVMGPYITSPNEYYWSQNSLTQIQAFAMTKQARCLENSN